MIAHLPPCRKYMLELAIKNRTQEILIGNIILEMYRYPKTFQL